MYFEFISILQSVSFFPFTWVDDYLWHACAIECLSASLLMIRYFESEWERDTDPTYLPRVEETILHIKDRYVCDPEFVALYSIF